MPDAPFDRFGEIVPSGPVVVSVPHAGTRYSPTLLAAARLPHALTLLEDRLVDLVAVAARNDETMLVQRTPRAAIDLNRSEDERDPLVDDGARPQAKPSAKVRSGLGLVPRRAGNSGELWRRRFVGGEVERRIVEDHRPYHRTLTDVLVAARARFGVAVLIDVHSMPPLSGERARVVLGDRFGQAAGARFVERLEGVARQSGHRVALNVPYAGGHILERHGRRTEGVHAVQVELDRTLYLDAALRQPGAGFARTVALLRAMLVALADEAIGAPQAMAAE